MHKTIYIDIEDEVTSIIDRIKSEGAADIFLVVPKNAVLVQGMLNLKILKKEASKLGKNLLLVTNDKFAKKVIERAGLETADRPAESEPAPVSTISGEDLPSYAKSAMPNQASNEAIDELKKINDNKNSEKQIGSSSFFDNQSAIDSRESDPMPAQQSESDKLREELYVKKIQQQDSAKRDDYNSPSVPKEVPIRMQPQDRFLSPNNKAGNSHRFVVPHDPRQQTPRKLSISDADEKRQGLFGPNSGSENPVRISQGIDLQHGWNNKKAETFFSHGFGPQKEAGDQDDDDADDGTTQPKSGLFKIFTVIAVIVIVLSASAAYLYLNYPKAHIVLFLATENQNSGLDIIASVDAQSLDAINSIIPATLEQVEIEKTTQFEATDEKFVSDDGKASGKVTIYNKYSKSPQPLVATTRVLSKDGKLFRLTESVTVPGMDGETPGEIAAKVIADKPGEEFNIDPDSFTIEGFKGTPKYEKFEVSSTSPMSGGSNESGNKKAKVVSASDIENARQKTLEELDRDLEKLILEKIGPRSKVLADTAKKEIISNSSSLAQGDVGDTFSYTIKEKIQVLVFSDEDARELLVGELNKKLPDGFNLENITSVNYDKAVSDYDKNKLSMKISAVGELVAHLDIDKLKKDIAGKNESGIQQFLENCSELEKAQIKISPAWLGSLPVAERKIEIQIGDDGN